jgi:ribosomal protein S18 acetylase RimI-like enzyme
VDLFELLQKQIAQRTNATQLWVGIRKQAFRVFIWIRQPGADEWQGYLSAIRVDDAPNTGEVTEVWIDNALRGQGIATFLYNEAEHQLGVKLRPSGDVSHDAVKFWKKRGVTIDPNKSYGSYEQVIGSHPINMNGAKSCPLDDYMVVQL